MKLTPARIEQFSREGYVLIEEAAEPQLMEPLRAAAGRVAEKTRSGVWPHKGDAGGGDIGA